jgi:hypothetical protein
MERARVTWTDERLDDLARHVDGGFNRLDAELRAMRIELGGRIDALQRVTIQIGAGVIFTMLVGFASVLVAQLA